MTEAQLEKAVIQLAHQLGYMVHGVRPGRRPRDDGSVGVFDQLKGDKGYPDLTIMGKGRVFLWELKADRTSAKLSADQEQWRKRVQAAGLNYAVIRPCHWRSGQVEQALMGREVDLPDS
jgi:hypothetical protein